MTLHVDPRSVSPRDTIPPVAALPSRTVRQVGFGIAVGVNAALLYLLNVTPGWQSLSFLTGDAALVLGIVNLSLATGLVVNLIWVGVDAPWVRALGELLTSAVALAAALAVLDEFPFDFTAWTFDPTWLVRFVLVLAACGSAIAVLVQVVTLARLAVNAGR
jgi:hypothetical protein